MMSSPYFLVVYVFLILILCSTIPFATSFSTVAKSSSTSTSTTASLDVLWEQAGIGSRRKKQNKQQQKQNNQEEKENNVSYRVIPDPLVPYDSIQSVSLVSKSDLASDKPNGNRRTSDTIASMNNSTGVLAEIRLKDGPDNVLLLDPTQLHQTSDYELWMDLRSQVDVSASSFSVVLGTNYFTSRQQLLEEKVNGGQQQKAEEKNNSSSFNAAACAWGIKMEPLAFDQYSRVMTGGTSNTSLPYSVHETGMHILTHVNPQSGKVYKFGASPDGLVEPIISENDNDNANNLAPQSTGGLLEIKSLWGRRHKSTLPPFDHCPNRYYDQIQGQLAICNRDWCDLMLFIPPNGSGNGGTTSSKNKRKQKRKQKQNKKDANDSPSSSPTNNNIKRNGRNYSIVRVKRNEKYWNETLLPELIKFCDEVDEARKTNKETL